MLKKWLFTILSGMLFIAMPVTAYAATDSQTQSPVMQQAVYNPPAANASHAVTDQTIAYRSGFRSPSPSLSGRSFSYGGYSGYGGRGYGNSGFGGSHLFSFGTGWLLGSMFHPFGGYYSGWGGYGYYPFSIFHILFDLFILFVLWRVVRRIFFR